jgi:hypothetical protein
MELARELGYRPVSQNLGKSNQRRAWIYEPTGKKEYMSLDQMKYRKARGLLQVVNKEPPLTKYLRAHGKNPNDPIAVMFQDMAEVNLSAFNEASPPVQGEAIALAKEWLKKVKRFETLHIKRTPSRARNEAMMLAFAFCLNAMTLDRSHQAAAVFYRREDHGPWGNTLVPEYRYINEDTVHLLNNMIDWMFRGQEFDHDYTDSDKAILFHSLEWEEMKILFKKKATPDQRIAGRVRKVRGAFFPYLSTYEKYDLSKFGIYHEFDIENYREPCFIKAYREYMKSEADATQEIIDADCEFLNSIIKTFTVPIGEMKLLSELLNINMIRRVFNDDRNKTDSPKKYLKKNPRFQKDFEILYHSGHFMLWEDKICTKLKFLKGKEKLVPISSCDKDSAIRARRANDIQAKFCSEFSYGPMERRIPYRTDIDSFFRMDDLSAAEKPELAKRLSDLLGFNVLAYSSLAALGQNLMHRRGCYKGVMGLRGIPAEFIRKCLCPIVLGAPHNKPIRVEGDIVQYDRKSSYPSVYTRFAGIPLGPPIVITENDLSELNEQYDRDQPEDQVHFYVCLDIKSFTCLHKDDPYPLLDTLGLRYMDRTMYQLMMENYDVDYDFISGYYFKGYNRNIGKLATWLYEKKAGLAKEDKLGGVIKNLMNGMWGKAMAKGFPIKERIKSDEKVEAFCESEGTYVYGRTRLPSGDWKVKIVKPLLIDFSCPQFSVGVSSFSRKVMQDIIYKAVDNEIPIYYSNTDCLCLRERDVSILPIGTGLGDFAREYTSRKFICLSKRKYIHCLKTGGYKICYGPRNKNKDPEEYFESLMSSQRDFPWRSKRSSWHSAS